MTCRAYIRTSTPTRPTSKSSRETLAVRVLGIDCGTERTGYGVIDSDGRVHQLLDSGVIRTAKQDSMHRRLLTIFTGLRGKIAQHRPEVVAIEEVFYAVNVKTVLKLSH